MRSSTLWTSASTPRNAEIGSMMVVVGLNSSRSLVHSCQVHFKAIKGRAGGFEPQQSRVQMLL